MCVSFCFLFPFTICTFGSRFFWHVGKLCVSTNITKNTKTHMVSHPFPSFQISIPHVFFEVLDCVSPYFFRQTHPWGVMMMHGGAMMPWPYSVAIRVLCPTTRCAWHSAEYPQKWWHLQRCRRRDVRGSKEDCCCKRFFKVVVSNMFYFHPYLGGKWSNLTSIFFQRRSNHQPVCFFSPPVFLGMMCLQTSHL